MKIKQSSKIGQLVTFTTEHGHRIYLGRVGNEVDAYVTDPEGDCIGSLVTGGTMYSALNRVRDVLWPEQELEFVA